MHVVANLYEEERHRADRLGVPIRPLSKSAREALATAGSLLRIFAEDAPDLWLEGELDPSRLPDLLDRPAPHLRTGRPAAAELSRATLWMRPPDGSITTDYVSRAFGLAVAERLGEALPNSTLATGREAIRTAVTAAAASTESGMWVAKGLYSAAGRDRVIGNGPTDDSALVQLAADETWLVEPWLDRVADYGACGVVGADGRVAKMTTHELTNDARGRFRGVTVPVEAEMPTTLAEDEHAQLSRALTAAGEALASCGYCGPLGVDGYRYRRDDATYGFHPLSEINPRFSFGSIARHWVDALRRTGRLARECEATLTFSRRAAPPPHAIGLVTAHRANQTGAWLEPAPPTDD